MAEPNWLNDPEDRAWRGYRRMAGLLNLRIYRDLAQESGLSEPDYDVLSTLGETPGHRYRLNELADRMLWSRSRLSHHVARMEQRGLVSREEYPADGRGTVVVLTTEGLRAIEAAARGHVASVREHFIDLLTDHELDALAGIADKVVTHLTSEARAG